MNISITKFKGTAPKIEPRLLSSEYAQISTNIRYDTGSLVPINNFSDIETVDSDLNVQSIFKYKLSSTVDKWLYFESDVLLTRDPIYSYPDNRVVISGLDVPRVFDNDIASDNKTIDSSNSFILGLPIPAAPTIALDDAGTGPFESRSYTVQYDRVWSDDKIDQGAYSNPAQTSGGDYYVDVTAGGTVLVSDIDDAPAGYGITHITVNRSGTTLQDSFFHFVFTFEIVAAKAGTVAGVTWDPVTSTFSYADATSSADLGQACTNQDYVAPPDELEGIVPVAAGMLAGFVDNYVYLSEPYQCHAWPEQYRISVGDKIVGLGHFGEIVVVCTEATPYIIDLKDPATATAFPIKEFAPCLSAAGIVSYRDAVVYPSEAGFMRVDRMGVANLTQNIADIHDIQDFNLTNVKAAGLGFYYYVLYTTDEGQRKLLMFNMQNPELGFGMCDSNISCVYADFESASLYAIHTLPTGTQKLGIFDESDAALVFSWKSKIFLLPEDTVNMSAARVHFDTSSLGEGETTYTFDELKNCLNSRAYNTYPINGLGYLYSVLDHLVFTLYVDGVAVFTKNVYNNKPFRLPSGFIGSDFEIALTGSSSVYRVDVASSMQELTE